MKFITLYLTNKNNLG